MNPAQRTMTKSMARAEYVVAKRKRSAQPEPEHLDRRVQRSKEAVLAATYQLLSEKGLGGASVDEVSLRSGVAKTTIYRHWPTRWALLLDACSKLGPKPEAPNTGSLKGDLAALAAFIGGQLRSNRMATVLPSILDVAERDSAIAALHSQIHGAFVAPFRQVFEQARQRGELTRGCNFSELTAAILGPLFYRRWFSRETIDEKFIQAVVDRAVATSTH
jgi:AcrR family transcriptional regulator